MSGLDLAIVAIGIGETNRQLLGHMLQMKQARETGVKNVVLLIGGFDDDSRDLYEIPEVRAFCRRLLTLGFISYLSFTTLIPPYDQEEATRDALGAVEVWAIAEGKLNGGNLHLSKQFFADAAAAVRECNRIADLAFGPLRA